MIKYKDMKSVFNAVVGLTEMATPKTPSEVTRLRCASERHVTAADFGFRIS